ncbi:MULTISPECIES: alcohol dehydrogenase catalytic domain-containing protein [unclassified Rhodococcus (in: high G+C Gram-positive bacteria)]|uniref:alcohol dehydrogenase catalytic domain-containing protein n=1 Tax=unclassified Rhodococcus (in: high G+C Gram-positive bacteria) TaxID=192944 RepID=UPI0006FBEB7B|nr:MULTISPECIES: alcohol dehydrogenase catalytic domain-containing protein [unclassified Rhodococcus (in: high G+C Gram-positive bacteria)]KQU28498.1 iditol 2-dehydrogenase [Rhodococcus sp. Leaf225]KQU47684.1 iditol 2-dehydrogenase [Rhodococcus sp. Leaf258]
MQGAVYLGDRKVELREFPEPTPGEGEVVVATKASGLCGSDLNYYRADPVDGAGRCIAGHEPAGVVHSVGAGVSETVAKVGDRVMIHHYIGCGACSDCRSGWSQMCIVQPIVVLGSDDHGGHAPYIKVPASTLVPLDDSLSFEAGAAISCGTGTAWGALDRVGDVGGKYVVVSGQGPVGLSATMLATAMGARVIAVDLSAERREQALALGAVAAVDPASGAVPEAIRQVAGADGVPVGLETSGSSVAASVMIDSLSRWGRGCFVGVGAEISFGVLPYLRRQLTVMTSWSMSWVGQKECADFIVAHDLPVDALFTHRWSLDEVSEAYTEFDRQRAGKGVIVF